MIWEFASEADPQLHLQPQWRQFMFGQSLLVAPILEAEAEAATVDVYFPRGSWYELWSGLNYSDAGTLLGRWQKIEAVPYQIPSYIRGGSILPTLVTFFPRLEILHFLFPN